jgi:TrmH family RNA methyltransferase
MVEEGAPRPSRDTDRAGLPAATPVLSAKSGRVRAARRLARRAVRTELGLFLAEGPQAVREALAVPGLVREVFALPDHHDELRRLADGVPWQLADEQAIAALSETVHPQGVVAVCRTVDVVLDDVLASDPRLVAVCADIRDPGNAGTVIRCADAAGAGAVVLAGESVDPHNGKAVRASAGSLFHLPVALDRDSTATVRRLQDSGLVVLAAAGDGEVDLDDAADSGLLAARTAWLFGNEAHGLPGELSALADHRVRIPVHGRAESLNLATAAAVCLYASARAHRR